MLYIFDLDNTLIFTDDLNNLAYQNALMEYQLPIIESSKRITRKDIKNNVTDDELLNKIIYFKQQYFISNLDKTELNKPLYQFLINKSGKKLIWTSADKDRTLALLKFYNIYPHIDDIIFSPKTDIRADMQQIYDKFGVSYRELIVFEDNIDVIQKLNLLNIKNQLIHRF